MIVGGERYPKEIREEAIRLYIDGSSAAAVADKLELKSFTVKEWVSVAGVARTMSEAAALSVATGKPRARASSRLWYISSKTGERNFAESSLEYLRMDQLDVDPTVVSWGRCRHRISYLDPDGKSRNYIPDFFMSLSDGITRIEETKPSAMIDLPINVAKFAAAKSFCAERRWDFHVLTEIDVGYVRAMAPSVTTKAERLKIQNELRRKRLASESTQERAARLIKNAAYMRSFNAARKVRNDLPVGSFSESGTNVNVTVLKIHRRN